ncbi:MAG: (E)-4-hydroxy-3-methylbut-2-enyl-diphosphate synthase [Bacteroidales bacterium]|nr:(E)-4-hydroxy-3-methylbut-2-enyl-diphosphate synthase [Bacteroidales bacterium]
MEKITARIGKSLLIGPGQSVVVQTMCNTHTSDVEATVAQCRRLAAAGAQMIRITVPGLQDVPHMAEISSRLHSEGIFTPLVADIHFSSATAIAVAPIVEKVRINPGNFNRDHDEACRQFRELLDVCRQHSTAIRVGVNHGSLGSRITSLYGNTPLGMAKAAMEWLEMCLEADFKNVVVSLKSSNTVVMVQAYRLLEEMMEARGVIFPLHIGVTEAGNGDSGRIKSCIGCAALLSKGLGNTVRVSLTEDPEAELPVARYLSDRYGERLFSSLEEASVDAGVVHARYEAPSRERLMLDASCDWGPSLLDRTVDDLMITGTVAGEPIPEDYARYLSDEIMQASRRRFYKPEYIACPGCGRTMYDLQKAFEEVKARTAHLKGMVIAVMGCIVNGPGEMADADWGYVGEGNGKVSIYRGAEPLLRHVPEEEAPGKLVELIEESL